MSGGDDDLLARMQAVQPSGRGWWRRLVVWEDEALGVIDEQATLERLPRHDASVGDEIVREYPETVFSVPDASRGGIFRVWQGRLWAEDLGGGTLGMIIAEYWDAMDRALEAVADSVRERARADAVAVGVSVEDAVQTAMGDFRRRWKKHLDYHESLGNTARRRAVREYLAQHLPVILSDDDFDTVAEFLVLRNGVLDLGVTERVFRESDGRDWAVSLMPHDPVRKVTMCAALDYDPSAVAEEFLRYLERALPSEEQRRYLQKVLGSTLTGRPRDRMLVNLIGPPATGKSVLLEVMDSVLGDYCEFVMANVFLVPRGGSARDANAAMPSLHAMRKAKLVVASEPDSKSEWNSGLLKAISGRDAIRSRALYGQEVRWTPRFVVVVASNDYIRLDVKDEAMIRRIHPVEFSQRFRFPGVGESWGDVPEAERADPNLTSKIIESEQERSGVLNWLLEGLRLYLTEGIGETAEVVHSREVMVRGMSEPLEWLGQMLDQGILVQARTPEEIPRKYALGLKVAFDLFLKWRMEHEEEFGPYKLKTFKTQIGNEASFFGPAGLKRRGYVLSDGSTNEMVLDRLAWSDWRERYAGDV